MRRREWLLLCATTGVGSVLAATVKEAEKLRAAKTALDHLLLGASNLDQGISWLERITGVKAIAGGSHPGVGTCNALVSLGGRQYLEIVAPDPAQTAYNFPIDVRNLAEPRLITWAASTMDINATAKVAREAGYQIFGPRDGSRARPDGKLLKWKTLGVLNKLGGRGVEPLPFFIQWASDSLHPSQDSPKGCELQSLEIEHPNPDDLITILKNLGIQADVTQANEVHLKAKLKTPKSTVRLS